MVLINVGLSQKDLSFLIMFHYSFTPFCLHSNTPKPSQVFFSFLLTLHFFKNTAAQPHCRFHFCFFFLCAFETTLLPLSSCYSLSSLRGTRTDRVAAVFLTELMRLLFYLDCGQKKKRHHPHIHLYLLCKSKGLDGQVSLALLLFQWKFA